MPLGSKRQRQHAPVKEALQEDEGELPRKKGAVGSANDKNWNRVHDVQEGLLQAQRPDEAHAHALRRPPV